MTLRIDGPARTVDAERLDAYAAATAFLSRAFLGPPDGPLLVQLSGVGVLADWPLSDDRNSRAGLRLLSLSVGTNPESLEQLSADYQGLFLGPQRVLACLYKSIYLNKKHLTFGSQTLAVRQWYRRYDLRAPAEGREPDDHIGLELGFVSHLCLRGLHAMDHAQDAAVTQSVQAIDAFASGHLLLWAHDCLDRVADHASTHFYRGIAELTRGVLHGLETDFVR